MIPPIERELYTYNTVLATLLSNLNNDQRGIITDVQSELEHNFLWKYDDDVYASAVSAIYDGVNWSLADVSFNEVEVEKLKDEFVAGGIPLGESGETALSGFTAASIVGALNELKTGSQVSHWSKIEESPTTYITIPKEYGVKSVYINTSGGLVDTLATYTNTINTGESGETFLDSWYDKTSIIGCYNKLADFNNFCRVHPNASCTTLSISASTETTIIFNVVDEDSESAYDDSTGEYTAQKSGLYYVTASITGSFSATTLLEADIYLGSNIIAQKHLEVSSGEPGAISISSLCYIDVTTENKVLTVRVESDQAFTLNATEEVNFTVSRLYEE
jgi:hypothetical protein